MTSRIRTTLSSSTETTPHTCCLWKQHGYVERRDHGDLAQWRRKKVKEEGRRRMGPTKVEDESGDPLFAARQNLCLGRFGIVGHALQREKIEKKSSWLRNWGKPYIEFQLRLGSKYFLNGKFYMEESRICFIYIYILPFEFFFFFCHDRLSSFWVWDWGSLV